MDRDRPRLEAAAPWSSAARPHERPWQSGAAEPATCASAGAAVAGSSASLSPSWPGTTQVLYAAGGGGDGE